MKKLLLLILSALMIVSVFSGCADKKKEYDTPPETTTKSIDKVELESGIVKSENYYNESAGFKIFLPSGYNSLTFGALDLNPKTVNDIPEYEYYLSEKEGNKVVYINLDSVKYDSINGWIKKIKKNKNAAEQNNMSIGYCYYSSLSVGKKIYFATFVKGKVMQITFENFTYDEAVKFVQDNFETI